MNKIREFYKKHHLFIKIITIIAISLMIIHHYFRRDILTMTLSTEQQQQVTQLLENSPTRCIGAYLINLPIQFKINQQGFLYYQNNGFIIRSRQQYLPAFKQLITLREQELKNTQPVDPIDGDFLKAIYPVYTSDPSKMQGIIFERMESISASDILRVLEAYRWQDNVTIRIEMKAFNGLGEQYAEERKKNPESYPNNVPEKLNEIHKLFERIKIRDDFTIPTEKGFCFLYGFMQGEDRRWKDMTFIYRHNQINDFYFRITSNDFAGDYALLDKPEGYVTQGRGYTIYKGTRTSNQLLLEEWIAQGKFFVDEKGFEIDDIGYVFTLGIHMTDPTYETPQLRIKMYYKIPLDRTNAYTEDQLMVIWREITNSIKLRSKEFGLD
jgi:hypothetical protein